MIGRQVLEVNRPLELEELNRIMESSWNKAQYNDFFIGRPTPASIEEYILLPATARFMVIVYPRKAGSFFSKKNRVILSVAENASGVTDRLYTSLRTSSIVFGIHQISTTMSLEKERKGPAEEALQKYTAYMKQILASGGLLK